MSNKYLSKTSKIPKISKKISKKYYVPETSDETFDESSDSENETPKKSKKPKKMTKKDYLPSNNDESSDETSDGENKILKMSKKTTKKSKFYINPTTFLLQQEKKEYGELISTKPLKEIEKNYYSYYFFWIKKDYDYGWKKEGITKENFLRHTDHYCGLYNWSKKEMFDYFVDNLLPLYKTNESKYNTSLSFKQKNYDKILEGVDISSDNTKETLYKSLKDYKLKSIITEYVKNNKLLYVNFITVEKNYNNIKNEINTHFKIVDFDNFDKET